MKFADAIMQIRKNPRLVTSLRFWSKCRTFVALDEECCFQLFNDPDNRVVVNGWQIGPGYGGIVEAHSSEFVCGDWVLIHRNQDGTWDLAEPVPEYDAAEELDVLIEKMPEEVCTA